MAICPSSRSTRNICRNSVDGWTSYGGIFEIPAKLEALQTLEARMAKPNFWDSQETARETIAEANRLKEWTEPWSSLGGRIDENVATLCQSPRAEVNPLRKCRRITPAEVVVPGSHADVAERRPAVAQPRRAGSPHVVKNLVIVVGEERWNL